MKRCASCYWFDVGENLEVNHKLGKEGFCYFNPPTPALIQVPPKGTGIQRAQPTMMSLQPAHIGMVPTTFENRRCKEWRTKHDAVATISGQRQAAD